MDNDPCAAKPLWSVLNAAVPDLTLAGVLAGFLIAVVAALVVQWYDRASPRMIALFASGVPALMISSFLFTLSSGARPPEQPNVVAELTGSKLTGEPTFLVVPPPSSKDGKFLPVPPLSGPFKDSDAVTLYCNQEWSEWLPAFAALLIGGSVLLCGLGWALVIYGDHLADRLHNEGVLPGTIEDYHRFFIRLSALLSLGATIGMAGLLIAADVAYLTATTRPHNTADPNMTLFFLEFPKHNYWYAIFFVFLFGVYVVAGSACIVFWRTTSFAWGGVPTESSSRRGTRGDRRVRYVVREITIVAVIVGGVFPAGYLAKLNIQGANEKFSANPIQYFWVVAAVYAVGRLLYGGLVYASQYNRSVGDGRAATKGDVEPDAKVPAASSAKKPEGNYSSGWLKATSYNVVLFAVAGAVFTVVVTNGPLWGGLGSGQTGLILFIGGLYPAGILIGLGCSVPADPSVELPTWKSITNVTLPTLTRGIRKMLSDSTPTIPRSTRR